MMPNPPTRLVPAFLRWAAFVASAGVVAYALHSSLDEPMTALFGGAVAAMLLAPSWIQQRRMRRMLRSGDIEAVLNAWGTTLENVPHAPTMAPLITATALAAHGQVDRARHALRRAARGPAWDAAIEHRLLIDTFLDVFAGEREDALGKAASLVELPLPPSFFVRGRVAVLRQAMGAFARAFSHQSRYGDIRTLERAAKQNPLVRWPMLYASAVAFIDAGKPDAARALLSSAPAWPQDSVWSVFHQEIAAHAKD